MSTSKWTGAVNSDWDDADNWSPAGVPGASSDVVIASGAPVALASASIGTVNSITDSSYLSFRSAGTNAVATFLDDAGHLYVDAKGGAGGTILNIGGALTDSDYLSIGNATLSAPDEVTAASLDNTGKIYLDGSGADQALLDIAGSAGFGTAGILSGYVRLAGDSAIEFKSGDITSLDAGAHLGLVGNEAFIEDSTAPGKNSALMGLASIGAGALFALHDGAAVSTSGGLFNDGNVVLDPNAGDGGSSLTLAGALTNNHYLSIGNASLSASDEVIAASLNNTGSISLSGSSANQALLDVTGGAGLGTAGVLSGDVGLGDSAIEFASGQITTIAASGQLNLDGPNAFVEDSTDLGSNSALTGLADIAGEFNLSNGASVSTGALTNGGLLVVDSYYAGGSTLSIGGALTNTGLLDIGGPNQSSSDSVTAKSFVNSGTVSLTGQGASLAALDVSGAITNNGSISITTDTGELAGAVSGKGSFSLFSYDSNQSANLVFDSSVSFGQTINYFNDGGYPNAVELTLGEAQSFAGTISGFGTGDTIDAAKFLLSGTTFNFVENSAGTGGTLTLHDGGLTANIQMTGVYRKSDFTLAPDRGTGTLVKFV